MPRTRSITTQRAAPRATCHPRGIGRRAFSCPRAAFTLIEVLVVVAIMALLVAILLPALSGARRQAKTLQCATNLRTIGQALVFYLEASRDTLPVSGASFEVIHKYVQKASIKTGGNANMADVGIEWYLCPGDEIPHTTSQIERPLPGGGFQTLQYKTSYGINTSLVYEVRPSGNNPGVLRKMSTVKRPSDIVSFCDSGDDDFNGAGPWVLSEKNHETNQIGHEIHHKTGNNFLYCDTHVEFKKAFLRSPPQYGLPPFPHAWIPNYTGTQYLNWDRGAPIP